MYMNSLRREKYAMCAYMTKCEAVTAVSGQDIQSLHRQSCVNEIEFLPEG